MARSAVTVIDLLKYNTAYDISPDAIDLVNDHEIDISEIKDDLFMVMIENTSSLAGTATFVASTFLLNPSGKENAVLITSVQTSIIKYFIISFFVD